MLILVLIAFVSGVLTVFSPCVLPILPIVLASGIDGNKKRIQGTVVGLVASFTVASLLLATVVRVLSVSADTVRIFAVGLLIVFAFTLIFPSIWSTIQVWIEKYWHIQPQKTGEGFWGGVVTGVSLGIVWTPCIGPVLASVATLSAIGSFSISSVFITLAYAVGTGLPLYYIARGGNSLTRKLVIIKRESTKIRQVFGLIVLITALFIWSGADRSLQAWTLSHLPERWTQLPTTFEDALSKKKGVNPSQEKVIEITQKISVTSEPVSKEATFEIYTHGTKRIFTLPMYHNLSEDVYIEASSPNTIHIRQEAVTWDDFFETLPFNLTSECLTTGLKETYCTNDANALTFYINEDEVKNALQKEIKDGDALRVTYGKK